MKLHSKIVAGFIVLIFYGLNSCNLIQEIDDACNQNDTLTINVNDKIEISKYNLKIEFDSVLSDSRCPIGAECVWEGNAEVRFNVKIGTEENYLFNLYTNPSFRQDTLIEGLKIKLLDVMPYPNLMIESNYDDYKTKVLVTKN